MSETEAQELAAKVGGEAWHSGGGIWLVLRDEPDGKLTVFSEGDTAILYDSRETFHAERA